MSPPPKFAFGSGDAPTSSEFKFSVNRPVPETAKACKCGSAECKSVVEANIANTKTIAALTAALEKKPTSDQYKAQVIKAVAFQKERDAVKIKNRDLQSEVLDKQRGINYLQHQLQTEQTVNAKYQEFYEKSYPKQHAAQLELNELLQVYKHDHQKHVRELLEQQAKLGAQEKILDELAEKVKKMAATDEAHELELATLRDEVKSKEDYIKYVESTNKEAVEAAEREQVKLKAAQEQFRTSQLANTQLREENNHFQKLLADANTEAVSKQRIIDDAISKWDAARILNESLVRDRDNAVAARSDALRDAVGINDQYKVALTRIEALKNEIEDYQIDLAAAEEVKVQLATQTTLATSLQNQFDKMMAEESVDKNKAFNPDPMAYRLPADVKGDLKGRANLDDELAEVGEEIEDHSNEETPRVEIQYVDREVIKEVPVEVIREVEVEKEVIRKVPVEVIREVPIPGPPVPGPRVLVPGNTIIQYVESNHNYWFKPEYDSLKLLIHYLGIALHFTGPRFVSSWYRRLFPVPTLHYLIGEGNLANFRIPTSTTLSDEDAVRLQAAYDRMDPIPPGQELQQPVHDPADDHVHIPRGEPNPGLFMTLASDVGGSSGDGGNGNANANAGPSDQGRATTTQGGAANPNIPPLVTINTTGPRIFDSTHPLTPNAARMINEGIPDLPPSVPYKHPSPPNFLIRFLRSIFHPAILPAFWPTVLAMLFHLVLYSCIIISILAYFERELWLAANEETRAFLHTLLRRELGSKMMTGFVGIWGESGFGSRLWWRRVHWSVSLWLRVPKGHKIPG